MPKAVPSPYVKYRRDGSVYATGQLRDGVPVGYWEWFRPDGTIKRSGHFDDKGERTGEWKTYDARGWVIVQHFILAKPRH